VWPNGVPGMPVPLWDGLGWRMPSSAFGPVSLLQQSKPCPLRGMTPWEVIVRGTGPLTVQVVVDNRAIPPTDLTLWAPLVPFAAGAGAFARRWVFDMPVEWLGVYGVSGAGSATVRITAG
jgi:hypothetical protein